MAQKSGKWDDSKIEELLNKENRVKLQIQEAFAKLEKPFTVLALVDAKQYQASRNEIIKTQEREGHILYIAMNNGHKKISSELEKAGIDHTKIFFIDMVSTERIGGEQAGAKNAIYLDSPTDLTDMILNAEEKLREGRTMIIVDSLSTMQVYNDASAVEKVMHTLLGKVNSGGASAIILGTDVKESDKITKTVSQFVDKTITI